MKVTFDNKKTEKVSVAFWLQARSYCIIQTIGILIGWWKILENIILWSKIISFLILFTPILIVTPYAERKIVISMEVIALKIWSMNSPPLANSSLISKFVKKLHLSFTQMLGGCIWRDSIKNVLPYLSSNSVELK